MKTYTLTINEAQADVLRHACDLYSRVGMGQLAECAEQWEYRENMDGQPVDAHALRRSLEAAERIISPSGVRHGIHAPDLPDRYRVAWDAHRVLRHRLAFDRLESGEATWMNVSFDPPSQSSDHALPVMERGEWADGQRDPGAEKPADALMDALRETGTDWPAGVDYRYAAAVALREAHASANAP